MDVVVADTGRCMGHGNCVAAAPDIFDLGDDGIVVVSNPQVDEENRGRITDAVNSCPVGVLRIESA
jgi:ferredoxin